MASTGAQFLQVFEARHFKVVSGYNLGAEVSFAAELSLDDAYELVQSATPSEIRIALETPRRFRITDDSPAGQPGNALIIDCVITLMSNLGDVVDVIVLVETGADDLVHGVYILPLAGLEPRQGYVLIGIDTERPHAIYGEMAFVSFGKGTRITLSDGTLRPIEDLVIGDQILTRDHGVQQLRWIGCSTVRAVGDFAPVRLRAGALSNMGDLIVSPDHRLLIYQRRDTLSIGHAEVFVRARQLVNDDTVVLEPGGFVDYYQLLFDDHQIVFAEGMAAETLHLTDRTLAALPASIAKDLTPEHHAPLRHRPFEAETGHLLGADLVSLLRQASSG